MLISVFSSEVNHLKCDQFLLHIEILYQANLMGVGEAYCFLLIKELSIYIIGPQKLRR